MDYLIPVQLGGASLDINRVLACASCSWSKGSKDLISWRGFDSRGTQETRARLLAQRIEGLCVGFNHLTHTRHMAPKAKVRAALEERWSQPRFTVYALHGEQQGWIGWTKRCGALDALGVSAAALRFGFEASAVSTDGVTLYEVPKENFLEAVWTLIDLNSLVHRLDVPSVPSVPMDWNDWRHHWPTHLEHLSDIRRRCKRNTGMGLDRPAPRKPRVYSEKPLAVRARMEYAERERSERLERFVAERARFDLRLERIRAGMAPALSNHELLAMRIALIELGLPKR
jgi:hypothetical protein